MRNRRFVFIVGRLVIDRLGRTNNRWPRRIVSDADRLSDDRSDGARCVFNDRSSDRMHDMVNSLEWLKSDVKGARFVPARARF